MKPTRTRFRKPADRDSREPIPNGTVIKDRHNSTQGEVIDHASQFTHPQAAPNYMYLVRWQDGQVTALSEAAIKPGYGLSLVEHRS